MHYADYDNFHIHFWIQLYTLYETRDLLLTRSRFGLLIVATMQTYLNALSGCG